MTTLLRTALKTTLRSVPAPNPPNVGPPNLQRAPARSWRLTQARRPTEDTHLTGDLLTDNSLQTGDCLALLAKLPPESVHLTVTSPPYDDLRRYDTPTALDLAALGQALFRVTVEGGVCAVVIGDASRHHAKSLSSFRLALGWCDQAGWRLFETCLYHRHGTPGPWWETRLRVDHEFIFVFFKGEKPRAFHKEALLIPTKHAGEHVSRKPFPRKGAPWGAAPPTIQPLQCRGTVWAYATSSAERNRLKLQHPATMPDALAGDLIAGFSEPGDLVLDPLMGSGTTCVMAARLGRRFVGMDASARYMGIARRRLEAEVKWEAEAKPAALQEPLAASRGIAEDTYASGGMDE